MAATKIKKIYFASDQHFGAPNKKLSEERERHFINWLDMVEKQGSELFLLGDLFDFWFEYKKVVPNKIMNWNSGICYSCQFSQDPYKTFGNYLFIFEPKVK